jgi:hypothetical protein
MATDLKYSIELSIEEAKSKLAELQAQLGTGKTELGVELSADAKANIESQIQELKQTISDSEAELAVVINQEKLEAEAEKANKALLKVVGDKVASIGVEVIGVGAGLTLADNFFAKIRQNSESTKGEVDRLFASGVKLGIDSGSLEAGLNKVTTSLNLTKQEAVNPFRELLLTGMGIDKATALMQGFADQNYKTGDSADDTAKKLEASVKAFVDGKGSIDGYTSGLKTNKEVIDIGIESLRKQGVEISTNGKEVTEAQKKMALLEGTIKLTNESQGKYAEGTKKASENTTFLQKELDKIGGNTAVAKFMEDLAEKVKFLGPLGATLGTVGGALVSIGTALPGITALMTALNIPAVTLVPTLGAIASSALATTLAFLPWILLFAGIAVAIYLLVTNFDTVKAAVLGFASQAGQAISGFVTGAVEFFTKLGTDANTKIEEFKTSAVNTFNTLKTEATEKFSSMIDGIVDFATGLPDKIKNAISGIAGFFGDVATKAKQAFSDGIAGLVGALPGPVKSLLGLSTGVRNFVGGIVEVAEAGRELVEFPSGLVALIENRTTLPLPPGTNVYNNSETEAMLSAIPSQTNLNYGNTSSFASSQNTTINRQTSTNINNYNTNYQSLVTSPYLTPYNNF